MSMLKDSSELREAIDLFRDFVQEGMASNQGSSSLGHGFGRPDLRELRKNTPPESSSAPVLKTEPVADSPTAAPAMPLAPVEGEYRGERLENALAAMCLRGGFSGAVVADDAGLPLAVHNSPVDNAQIAAFTAILGNALEQTGRFLQEHGAEYISMDINYQDKVVVRSFGILSHKMYLLVLCSQALDERAEIELSLQQISSILVH